MAEEGTRRKPLLNPVLRFMRDPKPESVVGGGKSARNIKRERLDVQRLHLSSELYRLDREAEHQPQFGGRVVLYAEMFQDSLAATWTPSDFFHPDHGARILSPHQRGYLIEADPRGLRWLAEFARNATNIRALVDISRLSNVRFHGAEDVVLGRDLDHLWNDAPKHGEGRAFLVWFLPATDSSVAEDVLASLSRLSERYIEAPPPLLDSIDADERDQGTLRRELEVIGSGDRLSAALRSYRRRRRASTALVLKSRAALDLLLSSGSIARLEPILPLVTTAPGEGAEPDRPLPVALETMPIVGIVDGGMTASSYKAAEAWRADPPLVTGAAAEVKHGNRVASLVVQGHDWNNNLQLPELYCRIGTVQAIAKRGHQGADPQSFIAYLDAVIASHPETRVWNLSLNQPRDCDEDVVSYLGHELAILSRRHNVLIVNSVGNKPGNWLQPPADCEAALTVGGRMRDEHGRPGAICPVSLPGPGPSSLLKPDASHFSHVRALGGAVMEGSSFASALMAPLAAHTMHRLRMPTPDLVKALLIHHADGDGFHDHQGFGSPRREVLPWECQPGGTTFQWQTELKPGAAYYWELPIPPGLRDRNKLKGSGKLTAILNPHPLVSDIAGPNYFSARLATAVQFPVKGSFKNLLGSMEREETAEDIARAVDHKWCPVRHHARDFSKRGIAIEGDYLRIYARIYTRDLYLYDLSHHSEVEALSATFVLTLNGTNPNGNLYDQFRDALGPYVESAVIGSAIDLYVDES